MDMLLGPRAVYLLLLLHAIIPVSQGYYALSGEGVTDDIIFSGAGSGCAMDDEDDCINAQGSGDTDALVNPRVKVTTTPQPPTTTARMKITTTKTPPSPDPTPLWSSGGGPCIDDEDCDEEASGMYEPDISEGDPETNPGEPPEGSPGGDGIDLDPIETDKPDHDRFDPNREKPNELHPRTTTDSLFIEENITETTEKKTHHPFTTTRSPRGPTIPTENPDAIIKNNIDNNGKGQTQGTPSGSEVNSKGTGFELFGLNVGLIVGIIAGMLLLILILAYAVYKYKSRDEGSYKIDESKNYPYESPGGKPSPTINGGGQKQTRLPPQVKPPKKKDVKEWYV